MNIAIDIGNTRLKCRRFFPDGDEEQVVQFPISSEKFLEKVMSVVEKQQNPLTWWIAQTGGFPWQGLQIEIQKLRPFDKFKIISHQHIPLKIDVNSPEKVGIDRLLAAFAAVNVYGDLPMIIVDAGTATTVDIVQNKTFCGGAIMPGLTALSETYPKISEKLSHSILNKLCDITKLVYPGKDTEQAIFNGLYWGTIGAIRQFYEMFFSFDGEGLLVLTGGDASHLATGLDGVIPPHRLKHFDFLVLEGIRHLAEEAKFCGDLHGNVRMHGYAKTQGE